VCDFNFLNDSHLCIRTRENGVSNLGILLFVFFVLGGVYVSSQVFPFYYSFYELQGLMQAQADKASEFSDAEIKSNIAREIRKHGIPADPDEDIMINRFSGKIVIECSYEEVFYVDFGDGYDYDLWTFQFNPRGESRL